MESHSDLNRSLRECGEATGAELEGSLQFDSPPERVGALSFNDRYNDDPPLDDYSLMQFNTEPVPSQLDSQANVAFCKDNIYNFDISMPFSSLSDDTFNSNSLIINTQHVDQIVINPSELPNIPAQKPQSQVEIKEEFPEFDLPLMDIDFEQLTALEKEYTCPDNESKSQIQHQSKTQPEANRARKIPDKLVASCPVYIPGSPSVPDSKDSNPSNLFTLDSSKSSISANSLTSQDLMKFLPLSHFETHSPHTTAAPLEFPSPIHTEYKVSTGQNQVTGAACAASKTHNAMTHTLSTNKIGESTTDLILNFANSSTADATLVPKSVKQLYDVIRARYSDFAFVYALSAQLCQDRIPMDCFVTLKMGLLLSLASIDSNPNRPPIPIIAIGNDSYVANYLMVNVGQLATRFVGPTDDTKAPSSSGYRNRNWIEADPILLAKGGVYFVGDWSRLKLMRADRLFKDIECSSVSIEKSTHVYPLETAVWSHWRSFKHDAKDQQMFNKFVKIFGIPIYVGEDNHEVLVDYTLEQSSIRLFESTVDHLSISSEDMRNFLVTISQRNVDFTPEASQLLQKYFVASRVARPDCLTKQAYAILKQFAESFAKLCFRHEVLTIDVSAAILLCEHFLQNVFGVNDDNPPPPFATHSFIGDVDQYMTRFQQWLESYLEQHYTNE